MYTGKGESTENQIEMCKEYISSKFPHTAEKVFKVYEDEGFSAKNTNRPSFKAMLKDIKQEKPDYIVCYRLDRISRSVSDFSLLIEELNRREISFLCIKEEFDTSKPMGKAMMYIASVFAQLERETIAERVRDNMLLLSRSGRWLGGNTPLGYTSQRQSEILIDGKKKTLCKLKPVKSEIAVVKTIFSRFLELESIDAVRKHLYKCGFKTRSGKDFSDIGIKEILSNAVYCTADTAAYEYFSSCGADICFEVSDCLGGFGIVTYNKRDYRKRGAPRRPMERWIIARGLHKGLISGRDWVKVQNVLKEKTVYGRQNRNIENSYSLLSGLIYCQKCGSKMFAKPRYGDNGFSFDYVCSKKLQNGKEACNSQNLMGGYTDISVCQTLNEIKVNTDILSKAIRKIKTHGNTAMTADEIFGLGVPDKKRIIKCICKKIIWDGETLNVFLT